MISGSLREARSITSEIIIFHKPTSSRPRTGQHCLCYTRRPRLPSAMTFTTMVRNTGQIETCHGTNALHHQTTIVPSLPSIPSQTHPRPLALHNAEFQARVSSNGGVKESAAISTQFGTYSICSTTLLPSRVSTNSPPISLVASIVPKARHPTPLRRSLQSRSRRYRHPE